VPQGAVAGDFSSRTQPFSELPSLAPPKLTEVKMWGLTPLDQLECRIRFRRHRYDGMFTPPSLEGSIQYPSSFGVFEWGGVSIDPARGVLFANTSWVPVINTLIPRSKVTYVWPPHNFGGPGYGTPYASIAPPFLSFFGIPCQQPPWGHMTAINLISRKIMWRSPLGEVRGILSIPLGIHLNIGLPNLGGSVVTAGGVLFVAAATDRTFRALDATTGEELWHDHLPAGGNATPAVYRGADGKQYVVLAAGGHSGLEPTVSDSLIAYTLP
jgi:quinoprotein glucose dehydrogenase